MRGADRGADRRCTGETPILAGPGPKACKRYLLVACTKLLTYYSPGDRLLKTFAPFAPPDMGGAVVVHDRHQNYDKHGVHVLTATHDALAGNPWMPPIPDPP